ncbi:MAG TPA: PAS domain-containing protein, partial [Gallionella sp.]|nr:PAS domain-containing protein [Gallionella sp.]
MRNNQPVTDNEYVMPDGAQLTSRTDLKGIITYCNDEFIEASGFSAGELIGAPHNLVRHPDMPEAAFADLWRTLKAGKPWTGIVKNRRKNGGFYWVEANVTPVYEAGVPNGYMSVRYKPTREQIDAAERLYGDMRAGRCKLGLHEGSVVRPGMLSGLRYRLRDWSVKLKLGMLAGMLMLSVALLAGYDLYGMSVGKLRSDERMVQMSMRMHAADLARQAQLHFGEQVQAWDNILLRSHDAEQFGSYARKFDEKSAQVRDELRALKSAL